MRKIFQTTLSILLIGMIAFALHSCSDDDETSEPKVESNLSYTFNEITGIYTFTNKSTNAKTYLWDFGDGTTSTEVNPTHSYAKDGTYVLKLTAISESGAQDVLTQSIMVKLNPVIDPTLPGGYNLIWADEFNTDGALSTDKWTYDIGTGSGGWGNGEAEYYTNRADNVKIAGGNLVITAKKEAYSGSAYTSARVKTQGKFDFKYGKVIVRAKLPVGKGTWPAIWTLGSNIEQVGWPACGEIDIMEHTGNNLNKILGTVHTPAASGGASIGGSTTVTDVSQYHIYMMEWTATSIKFYVDDVLFQTYEPTQTAQNWPFNKNQFLILNIAMGGGLGGAIDPAFTQENMQIDYVRVYQK